MGMLDTIKNAASTVKDFVLTNKRPIIGVTSVIAAGLAIYFEYVDPMTLFETAFNKVMGMVELRYVGYGLAAAFSISFGAAYYGPLMGEVFATGYGVDPNDDEEMAKLTSIFNQKTMFSTLVMNVFQIGVISYLTQSIGCKDTNDGCRTAGLFWLGFGFPLTMVHHLYNPNSNKIILLFDLFYKLTHFVLVTIIIVYFNNLNE